MKKIVTAVIGYGMSGRQFHLPPLVENQNYVVKSVMTRNEKNQQDIKKLLPNVRIITDYQDVLNDKEIDLIILATSNDVHYEYTKKALLIGKHVVCEKPFVETYEKAKELFDLAKSKSLILRVFHNRKYDGDILTAQQLIKDQKLGKLISFTTRFDRYVPNIGENWRFKAVDMAGIYYDLAPHLVHHAVSLFGLPSSVNNKIFKEREGSLVDDHFEMVMYYPEVTCFIGAQMLDRNPKPRIELVGTLATYSKYGFDVPDSVHKASSEHYQTVANRSELIKTPGQFEKVPVLFGQHYHFYDLLAEHIQKYPEHDEDQILALAVINVMECGLVSDQEQKTITVKNR